MCKTLDSLRNTPFCHIFFVFRFVLRISVWFSKYNASFLLYFCQVTVVLFVCSSCQVQFSFPCLSPAFEFDFFILFFGLLYFFAPRCLFIKVLLFISTMFFGFYFRFLGSPALYFMTYLLLYKFYVTALEHFDINIMFTTSVCSCHLSQF